jgi:hydroxymethylbilane synthase
MNPTTPSHRIRLGTRGSPLALWQARSVADALRAYHPGLTVEVVVIRTTGDKNRHDPLPQLGSKGLFVKEIEDALLQQEIDLAVHSMKDMPTALPPGLHFGAIPPRGEARDAYVGRDKRRLSELTGSWRIGTGSRRRQAQVLARYPTLRIQDIRGNVETRLRKMQHGEVDGLILAAAGLIRLGLQHEITELLPPAVMLPAPGQGALAVETLAGHWVDTLLAPLHDAPTAHAVVAERAFLTHLGGGCMVPIAAFAQCEGQIMHLQGLVSSPEGRWVLRRDIRGDIREAAQLGKTLADQMLAEGAGAILQTFA